MKNGGVHYLFVDSVFSKAEVYIHWDDIYVGEVLSSFLRIVYAQSILRFGGISVHASAVVLKKRAYLFMGKSGTGKSTHASLWLKCFAGCELLNDDNPVIKLIDNQVMAYGTPWSGKTPCYRNLSFPVAGMVRLRQACFNSFVRQKEVTAFITLLPGCSVLRENQNLYDALCDSLVTMTERVPVGVLNCLPDENAARVCLYGLDVQAGK